jgi:hydrogenase expression/formation protein HypE
MTEAGKRDEAAGPGAAGATPGGRILLGHGSGGKLYRDLVRDVFVRAFANPLLERLDDAVALVPSGRIAFTTDSHVVQPLIFPGGDIGRLSVAGTVNDLATAAARPLALAAAFIIEEGFAVDELEAICASMAATAAEAGVEIVTGDTKVVERGACDGVYITTTGVGEIVVAHDLGAETVREGDAVVLSGGVGDHAVAVLAARGDFHFSADVRSDCAPLWGLVEAAIEAVRGISPTGSASGSPAAAESASGDSAEALRFLRDPTRGGLTTVLAELAEEAKLGIEVEEAAIPVSPAVRSVCDLLGYDPLTLANEGKMVLVVAPEPADAVVAALRAHPLGRDAAQVGVVTAAHPGRVALRTVYGTRRVLDMPVGELLPRIC